MKLEIKNKRTTGIFISMWKQHIPKQQMGHKEKKTQNK